MGTVYPEAIDGYAQLPLVIDNETEITAETVNRLRSAIVAIENELGVNPSGDYDTVSERFENVGGSGNFTGDAEDVDYDNETSGLDADNVQDALDELSSEKLSSTLANNEALVFNTSDIDQNLSIGHQTINMGDGPMDIFIIGSGPPELSQVEFESGSERGPQYMIYTPSVITTNPGDGVGSGHINIITGSTTFESPGTNSGTSGELQLKTGNVGESATGNVNSGRIDISTGNSDGGSSGELIMTTGDSLDDSGTIIIQTGDSQDGISGDLKLKTGSGNTEDGVIILDSHTKTSEAVQQKVVRCISLRTSGAGTQTIDLPVGSVGGAWTYRIIDFIFTKIEPAGTSGDSFTIKSGSNTLAVVNLNGINSGTVIRMGDAAVTTLNPFNFEISDASDGLSVTTANATAASADGILNILLY